MLSKLCIASVLLFLGGHSMKKNWENLRKKLNDDCGIELKDFSQKSRRVNFENSPHWGYVSIDLDDESYEAKNKKLMTQHQSATVNCCHAAEKLADKIKSRFNRTKYIDEKEEGDYKKI
jgi:hypothetical protein